MSISCCSNMLNWEEDIHNLHIISTGRHCSQQLVMKYAFAVFFTVFKKCWCSDFFNSRHFHCAVQGSCCLVTVRLQFSQQILRALSSFFFFNLKLTNIKILVVFFLIPKGSGKEQNQKRLLEKKLVILKPRGTRDYPLKRC